MKHLTALIALLLAASTALAAPGDPPTFTVAGNVATFHADFISAYSIPADQITVVQGVSALGTNQLLASSDGLQPIVAELPPGTHRIVAFGYPVDRKNPQRIRLEFDVTIEHPNRLELIRDAFVRFSVHSYEVFRAKAELIDLKPTEAEVAAAVGGIPTPPEIE